MLIFGLMEEEILEASVPVISVGVRKFRRYVRELSHRTQAAAAMTASIAEESFGDIRTVRSFAPEGHESLQKR